MRTESDKGNKEIEIFNRFVKLSKLPIDLSSIEKRMPREPDILCTHLQEGPLAFELAEICDPNLASSISNTKYADIQVFWTSDPSLKIVRKKLKTSYTTIYPRELLCYTDGRVVTTDDVIIPTIRPAIESFHGEFRRVWLLGENLHVVWEIVS